MTLDELTRLVRDTIDPPMRYALEPYTLTTEERYTRIKNGAPDNPNGWHVDFHDWTETLIETVFVSESHTHRAAARIVTCAVLTLRGRLQMHPPEFTPYQAIIKGRQTEKHGG